MQKMHVDNGVHKIKYIIHKKRYVCVWKNLLMEKQAYF